MTPAVALAMLLAANCGGGSNQQNPPPPVVRIQAESRIVDVGQRFELDASGTTDPDGAFEDILFQWRLTSGGLDSDFDDHCRDDFDEICFNNADDHCFNDEERLCQEDSDCVGSTCQLNTGTRSDQCTTGICGVEEGDQGVVVTMLANVAGPYTVRATAIGQNANGSRSIQLFTYPSLYVVGSLLEFGGTEGAFVREVVDAEEFATGATEGASNPANGDLLVIDDDLGIIRVFDLLSGEVEGAFGESDRFVDDPVALAFHPDTRNLYVAQADGEVLIFDGTSGILITTFGNVGANAVSMTFTPSGSKLLVVYGTAGSGVRVFDDDGDGEGLLGETATATTQPVDLDFLGEDTLLIADRAGRVVACDSDGSNCRQFSQEADDLLAAGSPSGIAVNPSSEFTDADVLISDPAGERVIACEDDGDDCGTFGDTGDDSVDSNFLDVFFAPPETPDTVTTTTSTTVPTTTLN